MNIVRSFLVSILVCCFGYVQAQDTQFYQSFASPLTLNPGTTGMIPGNFRISSVYRDQWRAVVDNPFATFSLSADTRFSVSKKKDNKDFLGVGIHFLSDKVGFISFTTNQLGVSLAFHKSLNDKQKQFLSFGAQFGINQRNINYENLDFEDEFNGVDQFSIGTGETFPPNNFGFVDLAIGLNYQIQPIKGLSIYAGTSLAHGTAPNIVFDKEDEDLTQQGIFRRIQVYTGLNYDLTEGWIIKPRTTLAIQGPHQQLVVGTHFAKQLEDAFSESIEFGGGFRLINDIDGFGLESFIASIGLDLKGKVVGFSYETGLQSVESNFRNQGVFEISFTYVGEYDNDIFFCPEF